MGILVCGAVMVDIKGYPIDKYIPGGRNAGRVVQVYGGVSRNIVEDIANIGLHPSYLSVVDETPVGRDIVAQLAARGVDTQYVRSAPDGLGMWLAIFGNNGDVIASISKRPDDRAILDTINEHGDEIVAAADSIALEMDMQEKIVRKMIKLAYKHGKKVFAVISNMSIMLERRELLKAAHCLVCNEQEAGMLFTEDYSGMEAADVADLIKNRARSAGIPRMIVTLGSRGAVYADTTYIGDDDLSKGVCLPRKVDVVDTTGAGDAFFAGVAAGMTYGKDIRQACEMGTRMASAVIATRESVCPRFMPKEFGL